MNTKRNPETSNVLVGVALAIAGLLFILLPPLAGLDMMGFGYAMQFAGLFLLISGMIITLILGRRARRLGAILNGQNLLAHWIYPAELSLKQVERDFRETKARNLFLLLIVMAWLVFFTIIFLLIGFRQGEDMGLFVALMAGVLLVVAVAAFAAPHIQRRRALRSGGEAYIATDGLFVNGVLHMWEKPLADLRGVQLVEGDGPARLVFRLRSLSQTNVTLYQPYTVELLVPPGEEDAARRIEQRFQTQ